MAPDNSIAVWKFCVPLLDLMDRVGLRQIPGGPSTLSADLAPVLLANVM